MTVKFKDPEWEMYSFSELSSVGVCSCGSAELFTHPKDVLAYVSVRCQPSICK